MQKVGVKKPRPPKPVSAEPHRPAQYRFLSELAKERRAVAIFLVNGLKLEGRITSFDDYAILLEGELSDHVYKHAISTVQPLTGSASRAEAGTKSYARAPRPALRRAEPEDAVGVSERKPRQPTIVVRSKRRVIKTTPGE
ncbi:MAG: hfq [Betaproteobacteria bacterium]|nr:hfq [Betaproteobacteria bacterium]